MTNMLRTADAIAENPWQFCLICKEKYIFRNANEFRTHLRKLHCSKEGGSFVCHYGKHGVCQSLPIEGVNSMDYENHVEKVHIYLDGKFSRIVKSTLTANDIRWQSSH